jgi:SprB repeat
LRHNLYNKTTLLKFALFSIAIYLSQFSFAQKPTATTKSISTLKKTFNASNSFIENIGQYGKTMKGYEEMGELKFGYEGFGMPVLFTPKGLIHLQRKVEKISHEEEEKLEKAGAKEEEIENQKNITDRTITMEWVGANDKLEIITEEKTFDYHTYGMLTEKAYGYKKIIYKNIYDGIDIMYSFTNNNKLGFEYSLIVQPGADLTKVKMKYGGDVKSIKTNNKGNLIVKSDIDGIEETIPVSYYGNKIIEKNIGEIKTEYKISGNEIRFSLPSNYESTKALVIDPFVSSTSNLIGANAGKAIDVDFDYAGNAYVSGGGSVNPFSPTGSNMKAKYNSAGVLQWTFNGVVTIPSWSAGYYLGGWVVDKASGAIYMGQGYSTPGFRVVRISTTGLYDNYISTANGSFQEAWKMYWFCNNGSPQIICAGGGTNANNNIAICAPPSTTLVSAANLTSSPASYQDMSDLVIDPVSNSLFTIFASGVDKNVENRIFKNNQPYSAATTVWSTQSGYLTLGEIRNRPYINVGYNDNSSNILAINANYLFYWDGLNLKAFNKITGANVGTAITLTGNTVLMQGGVVADACDNVYIGNTNGIIKVYKFNGANFDDAAAADISITGYNSAAVYDLALDESKKLLYASGNGFVTSVDVSAYCPINIYTVTVVPNCATASAVATVSPTPPAGSTITYSLYIGTTFIATNTTGLFTGLLPNTNYSIIATINFACSGVQTTTNFILPGPTIIATPTNTTCGNNTGQINIVASGTTAPYTYSLDGITYNSTNPITGLAAGLYTVFVKDANGCISKTNVAILNLDGPTFTFTQTNATCGSNAGTVTVTATGGTAPYQYSINNGVIYQSNNFFTGLLPGTYILKVKDAAGCINSASITIISGPAPLLNAIPASATCGLTNGTINAFGSAGTAPLQYSINGNIFQPSGLFSNLTPGSYTVTVKDAIGCIVSVNVTIANNPAPTISASTTPAACGNVNGTITATGLNGVAPLTYSINGTIFQGSPLFSGLAAGAYTVSVKDVFGCIATTTVTVASTGGPTATAVSSPSSCASANGTVTVTGIGTAPFTYSINNGVSYQTSNVFTGLAAGNYLVLVKDAVGCIGAVVVIVNAIAGPTLTATSTPAACTINNGTITATGSGGSAPLQYSIDGVSYSSVFSFTTLVPNTYTVYVKDALGCINTTTVVVGNASNLNVSLSAISSSCGNNGTITAVATGGVGLLQYNINGGAYQVGNIFNGLAPGTYTINVKDANGCIVTKFAVIVSVSGLALSVSVPLQATCTTPNAVIIASGSGGTSPLTYSINGTTYQSSGTFINVAAGTYTVYLKDATGCIITQPVTITNTGVGPGITTFTVVVKDALVCDGKLGRIQNFRINGANCGNPCSYSLDFGPFLPAGDVSFTTIPVGPHYVTAKDAAGCTKTIQFTINIITGATATVVVIGAPCGSNTGQITLTGINGDGSPPYHASIDGGFTWVQFGAAPDPLTGIFSNLLPGTYTIIIADDSGFDPLAPNCTTTITVVVPATTGSPTLITTQINGTCGLSNASITAIGSGGGGAPYTYNINGGAFVASSTFNGLATGTYIVGTKDNVGCIKTTSVIITNAGGPTLSVIPQNTSCGLLNGTITVTAGTGGTAPYEYSINGTTFQPSNIFNNLFNGTYAVFIKDALGCFTSTSATISIGSIPKVTAYTVAASCNNSDGSIFAVGTLGVAPYQFSLDGIVYQSSNVFNGLPAGFYTMYMKDDRGCLVTTGVTISNLTAATFTTTIVPSKCGAQNGSITILNVLGGTPAYTYSFDGGLTYGTNNISNSLFAGNYTVIVKDGTGCLTTKVVLVNDIVGPQTLTAIILNAACGLANGTVTLTATGGLPAYTYSKDGITYQPSNILTGFSAGTFTVYVRDVNLCVKTLSITILNLPAPTISLSPSPSSCGLIDGTITATAIGGSLPLTYSKDGITYQTSNIFTGLAAGPYTITVKDAKGCLSNLSVTVPLFGAALTPTITCGTTTSSSIVFNWLALAGATGYTISYQINGGAVVNIGAIGNVLTYQVSGLNAIDNVLFSVTPTGVGCFAGVTKSCTTLACPVVTANISYGGPFCTTISIAQIVTLGGAGTNTGGTYSSTAGLTINATTGAITPSTSTASAIPYVVTYTKLGVAGCPNIIATTNVTINPKPVPIIISHN